MKIRNFCIIAHIDHGKSTLADRFLELTHTISDREKKDQILDSMDLERERGITIKMQPVTMSYNGYILNLIDTPGHVDFSYEVSRALAAVEGAVLVVDASQGVQAQTLANLYFALEQDLAIIPVINKIDLKGADISRVKRELASLLGISEHEIILISAKTGKNVLSVLDAVIERVPCPNTGKSKENDAARALIFDSYYDTHRGIICDVRIMDGEIRKGQKIYFYQTRASVEVNELGVYTPKKIPRGALVQGEIGYIVTGIREVEKCHVGDTILTNRATADPLSGYKKVKSMVFANMYPRDQSEYPKLKEGLEELHLNDSALEFVPASSPALGKGFRIGVLGLLHLDIVGERIAREYGVQVILTVPQVEYRIKSRESSAEYDFTVTAPQEFPEFTNTIETVLEPWARLEIVTAPEYIGSLMQLVMERRGEYDTTEYLGMGSASENSNDSASRALVYFKLPFAELLTDFYDKLKSISSGYASLSYEIIGWRPVDLVRLAFLVNNEETESLSMLIPRKEAYPRARQVLATLQKEIPPHMFEVRLQAAYGGKIIASDRIRAARKDVTAKLYGGDVTRKMKLLKKQKKGKKKMAALGTVDIPKGAFLAVLKR